MRREFVCQPLVDTANNQVFALAHAQHVLDIGCQRALVREPAHRLI